MKRNINSEGEHYFNNNNVKSLIDVHYCVGCGTWTIRCAFMGTKTKPCRIFIYVSLCGPHADGRRQNCREKYTNMSKHIYTNTQTHSIQMYGHTRTHKQKQTNKQLTAINDGREGGNREGHKQEIIHAEEREIRKNNKKGG